MSFVWRRSRYIPRFKNICSIYPYALRSKTSLRSVVNGANGTVALWIDERLCAAFFDHFWVILGR